MKSLIVLSALFAVALCTVNNHYSGNTGGGATWTPPTVSSTNPATCTAGTLSSKYVSFTATYAATDVPAVIRTYSLFEKEFIYAARVFVYTGTFDPANPCTNFRLGYSAASGAPPIDFIDYLAAAGDLVYVISGSGAAVYDEGHFAIHSDSANMTGTTAGYARNWTVPYSGNDCTYYSGYTSSFQTYTFTATSNQQVDVSAYFYTTVASFYAVVALYQGTYPAVNLYPADPCNGTLVEAYVSSYDFSYLLRMNQTVGQTYTIVVSTDDDITTGIFGIFVAPTISAYTTDNQANYNAPTFVALDVTTDCTASGSSKYWWSVPFTAEYSTYIIDTGVSEFDTASVLYSATVNNGGAAPDACTNFVIAGDTGDGGPLTTTFTVGNAYSAVVTGYGGGYGYFELYVTSGTPLGEATTTGAMTSFANAIVASLALLFSALILAF